MEVLSKFTLIKTLAMKSKKKVKKNVSIKQENCSF